MIWCACLCMYALCMHIIYQIRSHQIKCATIFMFPPAAGLFNLLNIYVLIVSYYRSMLLASAVLIEWQRNAIYIICKIYNVCLQPATSNIYLLGMVGGVWGGRKEFLMFVVYSLWYIVCSSAGRLAVRSDFFYLFFYLIYINILLFFNLMFLGHIMPCKHGFSIFI